MRNLRVLFLLVLGASLFAFTACSGGGFSSSGYGDDDDDGWGGPTGPDGDFGATTGGVKDMSFARELVEQGMVPPKEAFLVEAMFSEHDLPLQAPAPCGGTFCAKAAMGVAPDESGDPRAWLQVGLSSTIDPETWQRPALSLVFVVDVSGSMSWGYTNGSSGGGIATELLTQLASRLGAQDRVAIVAFDTDVYDVLALTPASNTSAIQAAIDELQSTGGGGTNIEIGVQRGFQIATAIEPAPGEDVRLVLLTDAQPNVGATAPTQFQQIITSGADAGVGTTVFGIALGLDPAVMGAMANERGGNAFTVMGTEAVVPLMEESWPWMFCPIAYDLTLTARPAAGFAVVEAYGFPGDQPSAEEVSRTSATVFLSRKKGGLLLELAPSPAGAIPSTSASVRVDFVDTEGNAFHDELSAQFQNEPLDSEGRWFAQASVAKCTALALLVSAMHDAAEAYESDHAAAVTILQAARDRFASDATAVGDGAIDPEIAFTDALLALMSADAPQGNFYP